ncbi:MAG: cobalamin biosynthesis protein [Rhizobiales bacterium]|nr:cobalamin biosynthesis protein [Hyphomicrobiales bacterium]
MPSIEDRFLIIVLALVADAVFGEPKALWQRVPHPVALMGQVIGWLDRTFNRDTAPAPERRFSGIFTVAALVLAALIAGQIIAIVLDILPLTILLEGAILAVLIAGRSLHDHVRDVAAGLAEGGLEGGRRAVAHIVGRDPNSLDEPAVARAAIESAGENFSDGVVAPVFWFALLGLPGLITYKLVNTADSMIGHRTDRHRDFGMAAARLDDALNWIPARLSGWLIAAGALCAGEDAEGAVRAMHADAVNHRSVNAGWPEAAMGGALGLALAGPRNYDGVRIDDAWMNRAGREDADIADIHRALKLLIWSSIAHGALYALLAILF